MTPTVSLIDHILSHTAMDQALQYDTQFKCCNGKRKEAWTTPKTSTNISAIDFLIAQDHNGLNAGSFFIRRSAFTKEFIDVWRDPMFVERKWEGKEQDALVPPLPHPKPPQDYTT